MALLDARALAFALDNAPDVDAALLAYAAYQLVVADSANNQPVFWNVPSWWIELIMPIALGFMAVRLCLLASDGWAGRAISLLGVGLAFSTAFDQPWMTL